MTIEEIVIFMINFSYLVSNASCEALLISVCKKGHKKLLDSYFIFFTLKLSDRLCFQQSP